jgi:serine/threonine protein kinase
MSFLYEDGENKCENEIEIKEEIKKGSNSTIKKAKFRNRDLIFKKTKSKDFHEVNIHNKLRHNNIPSFYGYYKKYEEQGIIMEYCKYGDLMDFKKNVLKQHSFSETFLCYIAYQILTAIIYLSRNKIVHFDIKPYNILIDEYLNIKLADYSISKCYNSVKDEQIKLTSIGTNNYMSPEILNQKTINIKDLNKIDIFSFGCLLFFLAFSRKPYEISKRKIKNKDNNSEEKIEFKEIEIPENFDFSNMFKNFVKKCLDLDINKRYCIYEALNDPWIKGYNIIEMEKNNLYNASQFLINMITDHIKKFNDYIR